MPENSCELCEGTDLAPIKILSVYTHGRPIHICKDCGLVQVLKKRSPKRIYEAWKNAKPGDDVYHSHAAAVAARHAYVRAFVPELEHISVVDIGGGDGKFANALEYGTNWALMAEDIPELHQDAATLLWTLENCGSVNDVLTAARKALRKDGILVVATGSRILVPFKKPLNHYVGSGQQDLHPWRFTPNTLQGFLVKHGFEIDRVNDFLGCDYLVVVAKKTEVDERKNKYVDNYRAVIDYFERWHTETQGYYP